MLDTYLVAPKTLKRLRSGPSGVFIDDFANGLERAGSSVASLKQDRQEHRVPVLMAFTLLYAQRNALAVDVPDLERDHLAHPQPGPVGHGQGGLMFEGGRCGDELPTSSGLSTTGRTRGKRTGCIFAIRSARPSVAVKKNFSPMIAAFREIGDTPWSTKCS